MVIELQTPALLVRRSRSGRPRRRVESSTEIVSYAPVAWRVPEVQSRIFVTGFSSSSPFATPAITPESHDGLPDPVCITGLGRNHRRVQRCSANLLRPSRPMSASQFVQPAAVSGKGRASRPLPPLRTVRASWPRTRLKQVTNDAGAWLTRDPVVAPRSAAGGSTSVPGPGCRTRPSRPPLSASGGAAAAPHR